MNSQPTSDEHRGLVIMSVLINFIDWLDAECEVGLSERERGDLVMKFLAAHSEGENYFIQAEQIGRALGILLSRLDSQAADSDDERLDAMLKKAGIAHTCQRPHDSTSALERLAHQRPCRHSDA